MGQNLLNRTEADEDPPETEEVWGCKACEHIFSHSAYMKYTEQLYYCPRCGANGCVEWLGALPYSIEDDEGVYLIDDDGVTTGPYNYEVEAQEDLWSWFKKRGKVNAASKKGQLQKGNLRLVSFEGVEIQKRSSTAREEGGAEEEADEETGSSSTSRGENGKGGGG